MVSFLLFLRIKHFILLVDNLHGSPVVVFFKLLILWCFLESLIMSRTDKWLKLSNLPFYLINLPFIVSKLITNQQVSDNVCIPEGGIIT